MRHITTENRGGFIAVTQAPTKERPHRLIAADGDTEEAALMALAAKLVRLGGPMHGDIEVCRNEAPRA